MDNPLNPGGLTQLSPSPQAQVNKNTCDLQGMKFNERIKFKYFMDTNMGSHFLTIKGSLDFNLQVNRILFILFISV